jgi:VWFA-related protein
LKKSILIIGALSLSLSVFSQQLSHETLVINIEVPVRVFKGNTFVENLTIDDFEVYEDGKVQKVEAVYLIKKTVIEKKEEKRKFAPETARNFYLIFEVTEFDSKITDAMGYFIQNILIPGDNLVIVTPMKTYRMRSDAFQLLSKEQLVKQLERILRRDALTGSSEYRSAVEDLASLARAMSAAISGPGVERMNSVTDRYSGSEFMDRPIDSLLPMYAANLEKLENIRSVDQKKLLDFAKFLKENEGQKYIFLFYQREFIPQIEPRILAQYLSLYEGDPNILHTVSDLLEFKKREISFDLNQVKQAYADASTSIHFLFFSRLPEPIPGVSMKEHSEDIFGAFMEMAKATGGFADSSANPVYLFQKAGEASENYYLLYYSPPDYKKDGKFRKIEVKIKNSNYRITNRAGYFSN